MDPEPRSPYDMPVELPGEESKPPQPAPTVPRKRGFKKPLLIALVVLVVAGLGLAAWKVLSKKPKPTPQVTITQPSAPASAPKATSDIPSVTSTKDFTAQTLAVEFKYPSTWTPTEKDGGISVISPTFSYQTKTGGSVNGYFKVYIRNTARSIDSKYIGRAYAVQPTQKLTYANPNPNQRKDTYLSFFGYDDGSNFAYFMITGNFPNLKKGDTLGPNYGKEPGTYIIVGGYADATLKDDLQFNQMPPDSFSASNAYKQAVDILKSLRVS